MTRLGAVLRVIVLVAAGAAAALLCAIPAAASFKYLKPGMEAAEFVLTTLDDREIPLAELKQSPATLLVFWATWSPKSEPALKEAQQLHERFGGLGLRVVAVNLDRPEIGIQERALIEKMARDLGLTMSAALDPGFAASSVIGVVANPALALIDPRGVLVWDASGWSSGVQEQLRAHVEGLLGVGGAKPAAVAPQGHAPAHKALLNYNLGRTFLRQDNQAKAQSLFESAAEADPSWAAPRTVLGHLLLRSGNKGDLAQAEENFRAAVAIDPGDVSALAGLGETLLRENRTEEALPFLEKAHELDATFTPAVAGRAQALARQGRQAEALALFDAALDLNPRDATILAGRASCHELAGDPGAAAADYRRAVEILIGIR
jgi:Flp pilus assembly protein TadD/peroxiredoxin